MSEWIQTFTGKKFHILDPEPCEVDIKDVAHALSNLCRFGGHCRKFYSVAQHCVIGAEAFENNKVALHFLLHDAQEAYLCDLPRPIKRLLPRYKGIEAIVQAVIFLTLGNIERFDRRVEEMDLRMLATERRDLMGDSQTWDCLEGVQPLEGLIEPWTPEESKERFLKLYHELTCPF